MRLPPTKKGFSLLEIIVAAGVFAIVAVPLTGSLVILMHGQRKTFNVQTNQDNIRFALELMAREIRSGTSYSVLCGTSCFQFISTSRETIVYRKRTTAECGLIAANISCITRQVTESDGTMLPEQPVTAPEVFIQRLNFILVGATSGDKQQPRLTIIIHAKTPLTSGESSEIFVETAVSQAELQS